MYSEEDTPRSGYPFEVSVHDWHLLLIGCIILVSIMAAVVWIVALIFGWPITCETILHDQFCAESRQHPYLRVIMIIIPLYFIIAGVHAIWTASDIETLLYSRNNLLVSRNAMNWSTWGFLLLGIGPFIARAKLTRELIMQEENSKYS